MASPTTATANSENNHNNDNMNHNDPTSSSGRIVISHRDSEEVSEFQDDEDLSLSLTRVSSDVQAAADNASKKSGKSKRKQGKDASIAREESRVVSCVRLLVLVLLLAVTAGVGWGVHYFISESETNDFEADFHGSADKVLDAVGSTLDQSLGAIDNLMIGLVSHQEFSNTTWPNVTMPHFAVQVAKMLALSRAAVIGYAPRVTQAQRAAWEEYASQHNQWVPEGLEVQRDNPTFEGTTRHVAPNEWQPQALTSVIHNLNGPMPEQEKYDPTWQSAPVVPTSAGGVTGSYNWDLYPAFSNELDEIEWQRAVIMGRTLNLPTPGNEAELLEQQTTIEWISELVGPDQDPTEPLFPFYYPIVAHATDLVSVSSVNDDPKVAEHYPVVGVLSMFLFWRSLLQNILSSRSAGIVVVFGSLGNCVPQTLTYQIHGPNVEFLGKGDWHDPHYDQYERQAFLHNLGSISLLESNLKEEVYTGFPLSSEYCPYYMRLYPSDVLWDRHTTDNPVYFTLIAISIFVFTSAVFLVYDCVSERRQKKVLQVAVQSTAVVSSLFPQLVRDRVFRNNHHHDREEQAHGANGKPKKERIETARLRLQQFLRQDSNDEEVDPRVASTGADSAEEVANQMPIAELFSETTVMFCDIAGFTAWSSTREPTQVFTLLESLYGAYDRLAQRRGVFKVETIGDSYVAVAGLPEPRPDHAVVMVRFARDVRETTADVVKRLGRTLGPDTDNLQVRIGLNSGPVTAGVLRGERSRFQLFGDTVNTASRMESTGVVNKIQITETTATLLSRGGKEHWVTPREQKVEAKGKGQLQTYWAEPTTRHQAKKASLSSTDTSHDLRKGLLLDDKTQRLVDWNVEIMLKLLKQIVSRREARETLARNSTYKRHSLSSHKNPHPQQHHHHHHARNHSSNKSADVGSVASGGSSSPSVSQDPLAVPPLHNSGGGGGGSSVGTVLEEVREVILLPEFDAAVVAAQQASGKPYEKVDIGPAALAQLSEYITIIAGLYRNTNPFHNFEHASHVTMSVVKLLSRIVAPSDDVLQKTAEQQQHDETTAVATSGLLHRSGSQQPVVIPSLESTLHDHTYGITSDPLTQFACVFSALIHDVDHPGVPNAQLVKEQSALVSVYKGKSLAEQNSVDISWRLLLEEQFDDLRGVIAATPAEMARFRQLVVNGVMATDVMDKDLKTLRNERWDKAFNSGSSGRCLGETVAVNINRKATIVIEHLIQASDVAHTMQHWHIFRKWNERLFTEMYLAYKDGRAETNPGDFWYKGEMGFFDFYIIPLAKKLSDCGVFGVSSDEYLGYALKNREEWENRGQQVVAAMLAKFEVPTDTDLLRRDASSSSSTLPHQAQEGNVSLLRPQQQPQPTASSLDKTEPKPTPSGDKEAAVRSVPSLVKTASGGSADMTKKNETTTTTTRPLATTVPLKADGETRTIPSPVTAGETDDSSNSGGSHPEVLPAAATTATTTPAA